MCVTFSTRMHLNSKKFTFQSSKLFQQVPQSFHSPQDIVSSFNFNSSSKRLTRAVIILCAFHHVCFEVSGTFFPPPPLNARLRSLTKETKAQCRCYETLKCILFFSIKSFSRGFSSPKNENIKGETFLLQFSAQSNCAFIWTRLKWRKIDENNSFARANERKKSGKTREIFSLWGEKSSSGNKYFISSDITIFLHYLFSSVFALRCGLQRDDCFGG